MLAKKWRTSCFVVPHPVDTYPSRRSRREPPRHRHCKRGASGARELRAACARVAAAAGSAKRSSQPEDAWGKLGAVPDTRHVGRAKRERPLLLFLPRLRRCRLSRSIDSAPGYCATCFFVFFSPAFRCILQMQTRAPCGRTV